MKKCRAKKFGPLLDQHVWDPSRTPLSLASVVFVPSFLTMPATLGHSGVGVDLFGNHMRERAYDVAHPAGMYLSEDLTHYFSAKYCSLNKLQTSLFTIS